MTYVFDTGPFIRLNSYFPDIFPKFWQQFDAAVVAGEIISTREVLRELDREEADHIYTWAKSNAKIFMTPNDDETKFVGGILAIPHFQQVISTKARLNGNPVADPFVVACAAVHGGTVVTLEKEKPNAAKIPNICKHFGVNFVDLEGFMRAVKWSF